MCMHMCMHMHMHTHTLKPLSLCKEVQEGWWFV